MTEKFLLTSYTIAYLDTGTYHLVLREGEQENRLIAQEFKTSPLNHIGKKKSLEIHHHEAGEQLSVSSSVLAQDWLVQPPPLPSG